MRHISVRSAPRAQDRKGVRRRVFAALAIWAALCTGAQADDADLGRDVYGDFCVSCHGRDMVNPGGVTFDLRKFPKDDFERFQNAVLNGKCPPCRRGGTKSATTISSCCGLTSAAAASTLFDQLESFCGAAAR